MVALEHVDIVVWATPTPWAREGKSSLSEQRARVIILSRLGTYIRGLATYCDLES